MRLGRWTGMLIVAVMGAVIPMAYATPPDQTWIAGLYDNADYDDAVMFVTSAVGVVVVAPTPDVRSTPCVAARLIPAPPLSRPLECAPYHLRAPPVRLTGSDRRGSSNAA